MLRGILALLLALLGVCRAQTLADTARVAGRRLAAAINPAEPIRLTLRDLAGAPPNDLKAARQAIEAELKGHAASPDPALIRITLTGSNEGWLWVGEVLRGGNREAVVIERAGVPAPAKEPAATTLIQSVRVWEQADPILDLAVSGSDTAVLTPTGLSVWNHQPTGWVLRKTVPIQSADPFPRDLRGRVIAEADTVKVFLPGVSCTGLLRPDPALECKAATDGWPGEPPGVAIPAGKNIFVVNGTEPFFSAAAAGDGWVTAGVDGTARLLDRDLRPVGALGRWGSDVAPVEGRCDPSPHVLLTSAGDVDERDTVQAFVIREREATSASPPVELPGPILALWPSDRSSANAIVKDVQTGKYAAFNLSLVCSR